MRRAGGLARRDGGRPGRGRGLRPSVTYRYRLTVEVETPDGMRSGSRVIETNIHDTHGELVGAGRGAPGLLARARRGGVRRPRERAQRGRPPLARGPQADQGIDFNWLVPNTLHVDPLKDPASLLRQPGRHEVPAHLVPTLVTFADVADPKSARVVYATGSVMSGGQQPRVVRETVLVDDFAGAFGPGYRRFLRATVEIVPTGIWLLNSVCGLSGQPVTHTIAEEAALVARARAAGCRGPSCRWTDGGFFFGCRTNLQEELSSCRSQTNSSSLFLQ